MNKTMTNQEIRIELDYVWYALSETFCYAEADPDCEQDEIPELVIEAQEKLLHLRSLFS
jgi:hypothetical protein